MDDEPRIRIGDVRKSPGKKGSLRARASEYEIASETAAPGETP
jgi:hypothetical protein